MSNEERSYFRQRAEEEIEAAGKAGHPDAARAHYRLAGYYLDLAYNPSAAARDCLERESTQRSPVTEEAAFA